MPDYDLPSLCHELNVISERYLKFCQPSPPAEMICGIAFMLLSSPLLFMVLHFIFLCKGEEGHWPQFCEGGKKPVCSVLGEILIASLQGTQQTSLNEGSLSGGYSLVL